jgi:hypothetical protein
VLLLCRGLSCWRSGCVQYRRWGKSSPILTFNTRDYSFSDSIIASSTIFVITAPRLSLSLCLFHTHTAPDDCTQYALNVDDRLDHPAYYHGPPYLGCHMWCDMWRGPSVNVFGNFGEIHDSNKYLLWQHVWILGVNNNCGLTVRWITAWEDSQPRSVDVRSNFRTSHSSLFWGTNRELTDRSFASVTAV